ncbi:MAG: Acylphosphatase [Deltaproteobacteria bacterium ADurb.Bin510]|nr:MAG: Acylphosphatase [Deltaproteobacteria bacterium ADurb.Bin510]
MKAVRIVVAGLVQGVWYRASTRREAQRLNLSGWVRNLPDGRVEIQAQGPDQALEELIHWCHEGPPGARVTAVTVEPLAPEPQLCGFEVRY